MKQSFIYINKVGFFGDFLFDQKLKNDVNRYDETYRSKQITEELDLINLQKDTSKSYFLKYPSYDNLVNNIFKLKEYEIIFLLRGDQDKERLFLKQYYPIKEFRWELNHLIEFADFPMFSGNYDDLIKLAKKNIKARILFILYNAQDDFEFNPSYLLNLKEKIPSNFMLSDFFSDEDVHSIKDGKYILKTRESIKLKFGVNRIFNQLFFDLIHDEDVIENLIEKFKKVKIINKSDLTDNELLCINILKFDGTIYEPLSEVYYYCEDK